MKRTDVHRPSAMDPADYAWLGGADDHATEGDFEFDWERYAELTGQPELAGKDYRDAEGIRWASVEHATTYEHEGRREFAGWRVGGCDHCGQTRIRYWAFYLHLPSGEVVAVGKNCAALLSLDSRADIARRAQVEAARKSAALAEWVAADERNERAYADLMAREDEAGGSGGAGNDFVDSLLRYARRNGFLSDAQRDAVLKGIETREQRERERAERDAEMGDPEPAPVVEGRQVITGRLLATKSQEGYYGRDELKMLVLDDRGFRVWGTCPGVIIDEAFELAREQGYTDGGVKQALDAGLKVRVRFTATVEQSRKDETFGFCKRPTKAELIKGEGS